MFREQPRWLLSDVFLLYCYTCDWGWNLRLILLTPKCMAILRVKTISSPHPFTSSGVFASKDSCITHRQGKQLSVFIKTSNDSSFCGWAQENHMYKQNMWFKHVFSMIIFVCTSIRMMAYISHLKFQDFNLQIWEESALIWCIRYVPCRGFKEYKCRKGPSLQICWV